VVLSIVNPQPESVPINALVAVKGTPMEEEKPVEIWEMIRMVAATRIVMPETLVRLSAGRINRSREGQAMCFFAGANSISAADKLLTTANPDVNDDMKMFEMLGLDLQKPFTKVSQPATIEATNSQFLHLGKKPKCSRPEHTTEKNIEASAKIKFFSL
jgi:biotin synthase